MIHLLPAVSQTSALPRSAVGVPLVSTILTIAVGAMPIGQQSLAPAMLSVTVATAGASVAGQVMVMTPTGSED